MSLKYVAAYLMASLAGAETPEASNIESILGAVGAEVDSTVVNKLISELSGKNLAEVIASGMSKLQSVPTGGAGGAVAASSSAGAGEAAPAKAEEKEEEPEEEEDLGFSLFD